MAATTTPRRARPPSWLLLVAACAALAGATLALPVAVAFDPFNWLIWGRELTHLRLDTQGGTVWKPLPVLFTTLFAPSGRAAPYLWLLVARTGAFLALAGAYRLGRELDGRLAGVLGAAALPFVWQALHWFYGGTAEWLLVAAVLWAVVAHLRGRPGLALALWLAAALMRPEAWPFLGLEAVWIWRRAPGLRPAAVAALAAVPALWLGFEWWGSGTPFAGSERAMAAPSAQAVRAAAEPWLVVLGRWVSLAGVPALAASVALAAVELRAGRRRLPLLAAGVLAWVAVVVAMAEAGYPGMARFMLPAAAVAYVLAGVAAGRLVRAAPRGPRLAAAVALVAVAVVPYAAAAPGRVGRELAEVDRNVTLQRSLTVALHRAGGPEAVLDCGAPKTWSYAVPMVQWTLGVRVTNQHTTPVGRAVLLRMRPQPDSRLLPRRPGDFRRLASSPGWQVLGNCPAPHRLSASTGRSS